LQLAHGFTPRALPEADERPCGSGCGRRRRGGRSHSALRNGLRAGGGHTAGQTQIAGGGLGDDSRRVEPVLLLELAQGCRGAGAEVAIGTAGHVVAEGDELLLHRHNAGSAVALTQPDDRHRTRRFLRPAAVGEGQRRGRTHRQGAKAHDGNADTAGTEAPRRRGTTACRHFNRASLIEWTVLLSTSTPTGTNGRAWDGCARSRRLGADQGRRPTHANRGRSGGRQPFDITAIIGGASRAVAALRHSASPMNRLPIHR
jgi:hypothetical protein